MRADSAGKFFDRFADTFDSLYDGKRGAMQQALDSRFRRDIVERYRLTFDRLGDLEGKAVLDIGCGSGVYLREALARGAVRVVGVDAAPRMLELAAERLKMAGLVGTSELILGSFPAVRVARQFDAVIAMGVMDYVEDADSFLRAIGETVREDGRVCLSFPSWHWFRSPLRIVRYRLRRCPLWLYRRHEVLAAVTKAGLTLVSLEKIKGAGQDFHVTAKVSGSAR